MQEGVVGAVVAGGLAVKQVLMMEIRAKQVAPEEAP